MGIVRPATQPPGVEQPMSATSRRASAAEPLKARSRLASTGSSAAPSPAALPVAEPMTCVPCPRPSLLSTPSAYAQMPTVLRADVSGGYDCVQLTSLKGATHGPTRFCTMGGPLAPSAGS